MPRRTTCKCIEQECEFGHLPECPYYREPAHEELPFDLELLRRPVTTGWMHVAHVGGQIIESIFTGPDALVQCALFQESTGLTSDHPAIDCYEIEVFEKEVP
jgi:hypothetical protein